MRVKDALGRFGEDLAAQHLQRSGFTLLDRNWRCRDGEIDIVAIDNTARGTVVFVEVKTRSSEAFGAPAEAVTPVKVRRMRRVASRWLAERPDDERWPEVRFDVVAIVRRAPGGPHLRHLRGVA